jgi:hypothetical protein
MKQITPISSALKREWWNEFHLNEPMALFPIKFSVSHRINASSAYEISNMKLHTVEGCLNH